MLDDLKKDRHSGFAAQERLKLSLYVAGLLILGGVIFIGTRPGDGPQADDETAVEAPVAGTSPREQGPVLDPAEVRRLADADAAAPERWANSALEYVLGIWRRGRVGDVTKRLDIGSMTQQAPAARGLVFEVAGKVTEVAREAWQPQPDSTGNERLWTVVLEGPGAVPVLAVKYGNRSDVGEGAPVDTKPPGVRAERIAPGQQVLVRGVYIQRRTGGFGGTTVSRPAPVLLVTDFRIVLPPEEVNEVLPDLDEVVWSEVRDRYNRESRKWDEDALYEVIQWARAQGYESLRDQINAGTMPWKAWGRERFETWKKEVAVEEDVERPVTEASRGKLFRFSGVVGEVLDFGWATVPRNHFGVDRFQKLTLLSDHYRNVALELFLPYPLTSFEGVTGDREQHLRLYGVFVKNFTYDTQFKREDGSGRRHPATVPMFVVLHGEPYPEEEAGAAMRNAMLWVAVAMVLFGLLFYVVLIRGGAKQTKRMEEHRMALRKRIRAKGQGAHLPESRDEIPPEDG